MSARRGFLLFRASLLNAFRPEAESIAAPLSFSFLRHLAGGTFLDRNNVTERVLHVVRHFDKIDATKVFYGSGLKIVF